MRFSNNILKIYKISKIVANGRKIQIFSKNLLKFTKRSERPEISRHEYSRMRMRGWLTFTKQGGDVVAQPWTQPLRLSHTRVAGGVLIVPYET